MPTGAICIAPTKQMFAEKVQDLLGCPVVLGCKGDYMVDKDGNVRKPLDRVYVDCSATVSWTYYLLTGIDLRADHGAQKFHDICPELLVEGTQQPGDLGFMGFDDRHVGHVVVALAGGRVLSADGADSSLWTFDELFRVLSDDKRRVRLYDHVPHTWGAEHFLGFRRNTLFDRFAEPPKES